MPLGPPVQRLFTDLLSQATNALFNPYRVIEVFFLSFLLQLGTQSYVKRARRSDAHAKSIRRSDTGVTTDSNVLPEDTPTTPLIAEVKVVTEQSEVEVVGKYPRTDSTLLASQQSVVTLDEEDLISSPEAALLAAQDATDLTSPQQDVDTPKQAETLPGELLLSIMSYVADAQDLMNLALTCRLLTKRCLRVRDAIPYSYRIFLPPRYIEDRAAICRYLGFDTAPYYHAIACGENSWFFDVTIALGVARGFKEVWQDSCMKLLENSQAEAPALIFEGVGWKRLAWAREVREGLARL